MTNNHFQDPHWKWGPPKCSSQGSPHPLVFKSLKATWARCTQGSGCCLTERSSKLLSRVIPKGDLGSHQLEQDLHKTQPQMASSSYRGTLLLQSSVHKLSIQTWMSSKQLQHLEQSGSASQKVLSGQGIGILLIFPNYEAGPVLVRILKIQWIHNWKFIYKTGKHWLQSRLQLFLGTLNSPRTTTIKFFWA